MSKDNPNDNPEAMNMTPREFAAWKRCQGFKLPGGYRLELGMYSNRRGALTAIGSDGIPECTVTVNLVDEPIEEGEFFVRKETLHHAPIVFDGLLQSGLAAPTKKVVSAGRVTHYAEVWRLAL